MNTKLTLITLCSMFVYAYILVCFGVVGPYFQDIALVIGGYILKYGLIIFGLFMSGFLPYRISQALKQREERKYEIESERKIVEAAQRQKNINDKIYNEYIKNEDAI